MGAVCTETAQLSMCVGVVHVSVSWAGVCGTVYKHFDQPNLGYAMHNHMQLSTRHVIVLLSVAVSTSCCPTGTSAATR
jgi:hypothetical protein